MIRRAVLPLFVRIGRAEFVQFLVSAGYLMLAGIAMWVALSARNEAAIPLAAGSLTIAGAVLAWWLSHRRWHLINDTPTSKIRSAHQGYIELAGQARLLPGQRPLAFNGLPPSVWYQVLVSERAALTTPTGNDWVKVSDELFALEDETGRCVIDPDHCEVHGAHERRWSMDGARYHARFLMEGDSLYALGDLHTQRASDGSGDFRADVADQLRQWKSNSRSMLNRFDVNRDGTIDMQEYQVAVAEAERLVRAQTRDLQAHPEIHVLRAPKGSYPFILSNTDPESVARRFKRWAAFHAAMAVLAGCAVAYVLAT